jgi:hypothetical protein
MPLAVWLLLPSEWVTLGLAGVLLILLALIGYRTWIGSRVSPEEMERQRRRMLVASGKMGDATLIEARDQHLFYTYDVRGIEYTASQDVSRLEEFLPAELPLSAPVLVRYDGRNPANSIIIAEEWTGLRPTRVS